MELSSRDNSIIINIKNYKAVQNLLLGNFLFMEFSHKRREKILLKKPLGWAGSGGIICLEIQKPPKCLTIGWRWC